MAGRRWCSVPSALLSSPILSSVPPLGRELAAGPGPTLTPDSFRRLGATYHQLVCV